jgi:hypothetical protein
LPAIALDSNDHSTGKNFDNGECNSVRRIIVEPKPGQPGGTGDHAPERFPERRAPGPHGPDISVARLGLTIGVRVKKAEHIVPLFLAA